MIDQFAIHDHTESQMSRYLQEAFGPNWVIAPRTARTVQKYGESVVCVSQKRYTAMVADIHERCGCPPRCPARKKVSA